MGKPVSCRKKIIVLIKMIKWCCGERKMIVHTNIVGEERCHVLWSTLYERVGSGAKRKHQQNSFFLVPLVKPSLRFPIRRFFSSSENGHVERGKWSCTEISSRENDIMYFDRLWTSGWGVGRKGNISNNLFSLVTWQNNLAFRWAVMSRGQNLPC